MVSIIDPTRVQVDTGQAVSVGARREIFGFGYEPQIMPASLCCRWMLPQGTLFGYL